MDTPTKGSWPLARSRAGRPALVAAAIVALLFVASPAFAEGPGRRVALVIGNSNYQKAARLANPANDAVDMAASLRRLGFEVVALVDGGQERMDAAVEDFRGRLAGAEAGLFYYAGHGVQSQGANYLLPVEANIAAEYQLRSKALDASMVLDAMSSSGCRLNIVVLDACRDNPFAATRGSARGLSVMGAAPSGAIIVYATDPGKAAADGAGRNGVFTQALLSHIEDPGIDVKAMFDRVGADVARATGNAQNPWISSKFYGTFLLAPGAPAPEAAAKTKASPTPSVSISRGPGSILASASTAGELWLDGVKLAELPAGSAARLDPVEPGIRSLEMRYPGGERESRTVAVESGTTSKAAFAWTRPAAPPPSAPAAPPPSASARRSEPKPAAPRSGLVAEYLFDGDARDTSGKANDGAMRDIRFAPDRFGRPDSASAFNGRSSYVEVRHSPAVDLSRNYSVSLWIQPDGSQSGAAILAKNEAGNDQYFIALAYGDRVGMEQNNRDRWYYATIRFAPGAWNHVCAVVRDDRISIYVNGRADPASPFPAIRGQRNRMPLLIGSSMRSSDSGKYFSGKIDDVRLYDRALEAAEILGLYGEGGWNG